MAHRFPTFAKAYGWIYILYMINQAFLAYWYPQRIFGFHDATAVNATGGRAAPTWRQYEKSNYMFAARTMAIALLGIMAQLNPPKMTGCIYMFSAFWIVNIWV